MLNFLFIGEPFGLYITSRDPRWSRLTTHPENREVIEEKYNNQDDEETAWLYYWQ